MARRRSPAEDPAVVAAPVTAEPAAPVVEADVLEKFHPAVRAWFRSSFGKATEPQVQGWSAIARGESTLILAPTGSGKTLAAFLYCLNRLLFEPQPETARRCRILYVSPIKALAVDIERNLRAPLIGIARVAEGRGAAFSMPEIRIRTGDTTQRERAQFLRHPSDILITTPESLYLMLTSSARTLLGGVDTVIIDEIHTLVGSKRGSHLVLSLERLAALCGRPLQRIGLSATARPFDEVAHFLGGATVPPEAEPDAAGEPGADAEPDPGPPPARFRPVTIVSTAPRRRLDLKIQVPVEDMGRLANFEEIPSGSAAQGPRRPTIWTALQPQLLELIRAHQTTLLFVNSRRVAERLAAALNELAAEEARDAEQLVDAPLGAHGAKPELAVVRAHHGSLAYKQRQEIEDQLKLGQLRALVATSSLELGIDMGTVDLVIQIESPPSVASGLQRIGRASHQVGGTAKGIIFPRFRADLLACAAAARAMREGRVEATRYPRSPLDVLAQQLVAIVATEPQRAETLYRLVRGAAPFADLSRATFDGVLDLLTGRYPSDEFADLRPRLTWDRVTGRLTPREGALRLAILNGGTIPDRGLFGVFLAGERSANSRHSTRVGELDEEMVFESRPGDTFMLGATTWRIQEITHDRVLVTPAPGEAGKMPFWRGDAVGRPLEFGEEIGRLCRELRELPAAAAQSKLIASHDLDDQAAQNLLRYLDEQLAATRVLPDDQNIVIERYRDELGDLRLCVLTPLGGRVHAPWCLAAVAKLRARLGYDPESMWTDDGFVIRIPENEAVPDPDILLPEPEEVEALVMQQLGGSALLAAKFREAAARALLLPRRRPGTRAPLWHQRKRAFDLLKVAAQYPGFPILLEAYRECLRDVFDLPALLAVLRRVRRRELHVTTIDTQKPSPFAAALLFSYVAQYIYQGDAPLAERRAQALAIDLEQLRELLGSTDLRELLDAGAIEEIEAQLQGLPSLEQVSEPPPAEPGNAEDQDAAAPRPEAPKPWLFLRSADGLHDLLLRVGDLTEAEIARRCSQEEPTVQAAKLVRELLTARRIARVQVAGESRYIAVEDAARYRDALGVPLPGGLPESLLTTAADPLTGLCRRYARTHGPFTVHELAQRFALPPTTVEPLLRQLCEDGRLIEGEFRPQGLHREFCDTEVLQKIRRKSLAKLRREVEPAPAHALGRLYTHWQGVLRPRRGLDVLLDTIQSLQGAPLVASTLESEVLAARVSGYSPSDLDTLIAAGEIGWVGLAPLGEHDGRLMLGLADQLATLLPPPEPAAKGEAELTPPARAILEHLRSHGASFFLALHEASGGGFTGDTVRTLWDLVWQGLITNDTFAVLRALQRGERSGGQNTAGRGGGGFAGLAQGFRSRRTSCPPSAQGRWVLVRPVADGRAVVGAGVVAAASEAASRGAAFSAAQAQQLLARYGVLTREAVLAEDVPGGFGAIYPALKALEDGGRVRRGLLVSGLGATQFALPPALDLLRTLRDEPPEPEVVRLSAVDPANPYGAALRWPVPPDDRPTHDKPVVSDDPAKNGGGARTLSRTAGSSVILVDGALAAYMRRRSPDLVLFLPPEEPGRSRVARAVARKLAEGGPAGLPQPRRSLFTIATVNQVDASQHPFASALTEAGFFGGAGILGGYRLRHVPTRPAPGRSFSDADYARYQATPLPDAEQDLEDDPEIEVDEEPADAVVTGGDDA